MDEAAEARRREAARPRGWRYDPAWRPLLGLGGQFALYEGTRFVGHILDEADAGRIVQCANEGIRLWCTHHSDTELFSILEVERLVYILRDGLEDDDSRCLREQVNDHDDDRWVNTDVESRRTGKRGPVAEYRPPVNLRKMSTVEITSRMIDEAEARRPAPQPGAWVAPGVDPRVVCPICHLLEAECSGHEAILDAERRGRCAHHHTIWYFDEDLGQQRCSGCDQPMGSDASGRRIEASPAAGLAASITASSAAGKYRVMVLDPGSVTVQACPECRQGKHSNCTGIAFDSNDAQVPCPCSVCPRSVR
jgi:hypothetical protein